MKHRIRRAVVVLAIAVVLAPLLGGLLFSGIMFLARLAQGREDDVVGSLPAIVLLGAVGGYLMGLVPAIIGGVIAALRVLRVGGLSFGWASLSAISGGLMGGCVISLSTQGHSDSALFVVLTGMSFIVGSLLWLVLRRHIGLPKPALEGIASHD
jgi:hypothetical protein